MIELFKICLFQHYCSFLCITSVNMDILAQKESMPMISVALLVKNEKNCLSNILTRFLHLCHFGREDFRWSLFRTFFKTFRASSYTEAHLFGRPFKKYYVYT